MIYSLGILDDVGDAIVQSLRSLMGSTIAYLFEFISTLYQVFIYISKAQIIDNDYIYPIYRKVGFILSLFMIFKLSFALIQALVSPDKLTDKKNGFGAIVGRCILSIVLLGITPSIFKEALSLQNIIVGSSNRDNIIYKFIVNKSAPGNFNTLGRRLASDLYFNFFTDVEEPKMSGAVINLGSNTSQANRFPEENITNLQAFVEEGDVNNQISSFHDTVPYLALKGENEKYIIEFNWICLLGFGIACVWFFVSYCIQVGLRVIQLAYLQIIAPIPILSYISDPDGAFKKWIKQCTATYLDLFIRLAIIYFVMTLIGDIIEQFKNSSGIIMETTGLSADSPALGMVKVFIILGLLMFVKKVPDLLKDLFPNMGGGAASLGFGIKGLKKTLADVPLLGGAANKVLGYTGNLGKKVGKFAWDHTGKAAGNAIWKKTGGKLKANYDRRKEDRKNAAEIKELEKPGKRLYDKYGSDNIASAFKNEEFKNSYRALKDAKDENREAESAYEVAKASGDSEVLQKAIERKNTAAKALSDAQKTHDNMRKRYGADARREDQISMYKSLHPTGTKPSGGSNQGNGGNSAGQNLQSSNSNVRNSTFENITNGTADGNPYETGHNQFTTDSMSENITNTTTDGNPYETGHSQFTTDSMSRKNNGDEDDNPYVNPNYYNDNSQNTNNSNDNDEFDGSNYY